MIFKCKTFKTNLSKLVKDHLLKIIIYSTKIIIFSLAILLYYLEENQYTKALPALTLIYFSPDSFLSAALFLAATGDYLLEIDETLISGILAFTASHLFSIKLTRIYPLYEHLKGLKRWFIIPVIILSSISIFITTQVDSEKVIPILIYTHTLASLLLVSIGIAIIYHRKKDSWKELHPKLKYPTLLPIGVFVFVISDIFVLGDLLDLDLPDIGLPLYWESLFIITSSYGFIYTKKQPQDTLPT